MKAEPAPIEALPDSHARTLYLIRHGESRWNRAAKKRHLWELLTKRDHPLTERGYAQALELQHDLQHAIELRRVEDGGAGSSLGDLADATDLWSSPLTRAMQTALVALRPLLRSSSRSASLWLKPCARERKKFGGQDTRGAAVGAACSGRALALLPCGDDEKQLAELRAVDVDASEVQKPWWTRGRFGRESSRQLTRRIEQLLAQLQATPEGSVGVVVGHSGHARMLRRLCLHLAPQGSEA